MKLKAWLDEERGRGVALAAHLGVDKSMVSQMAGEGEHAIRVPPTHYRAIRNFTNGAVTLEDLLPDPVRAVAAGHGH